MSEGPTPSERVAQTLQASVAEDEDLNGSVLMGWVSVAEWMAPDGNRWLSRMAGDVRGLTPPAWQIKGYLNDTLDDMASPIFLADEDPDDDEC